MKVFPVYYFPPVSWFVAAAQEKVVLLEKYEHYKKQQYFNRMRILTSNKVLTLSIPIHKARENTIISKREIFFDGKWMHDHWVSLTSAYRSSPYFEFYEDYFEPFFKEKNPSLLDRNVAIIQMLREVLQLDFEIRFTEKFQGSDQYEIDYRRVFNPRGATAATWFAPQPYLHVFGDTFHPDLSILDLLCNQGPAAGVYLKNSFRDPS